MSVEIKIKMFVVNSVRKEEQADRVGVLSNSIVSFVIIDWESRENLGSKAIRAPTLLTTSDEATVVW